MRTGKYLKGVTYTNQHPFRLRSIQFFVEKYPYNSEMVPQEILNQANFNHLLFTTQKNRVRGEYICHSRTIHTIGCPVAALHFQVAQL